MPSIATWWCGEPPALDYALRNLDHLVIKPAYPTIRMEPIFVHGLDKAGPRAARRPDAGPAARVRRAGVGAALAGAHARRRLDARTRCIAPRLCGCDAKRLSGHARCAHAGRADGRRRRGLDAVGRLEQRHVDPGRQTRRAARRCAVRGSSPPTSCRASSISHHASAKTCSGWAVMPSAASPSRAFFAPRSSASPTRPRRRWLRFDRSHR